jgi:hypothetical protein
VRPEPVQGSVLHVEGDDTDALSLRAHEQVEGKVLDEEVGVVLEGLSVEGVKHGVSRSIGGGSASVSCECGRGREISDDTQCE